MSQLLDQVIPVYQASSRHAITIAASPATVYRAARHADLGRPPLVRLLMALRSLPALLALRGRGRVRAAEPPKERYAVGAAGFTLVGEIPGEEFVLGIMGRFWTLSGGLIPATAEQLRRPPPAGTVQGFWNFRVESSGDGSTLSTETRVRCADEETRRRFLRYWRIIRPGSALIRRSILRSIKAGAERR